MVALQQNLIWLWLDRNSEMTAWAKRIKMRMKEMNMTQEELANKLGVTRGAITHYLAGRRVPPLLQFQKLGAILKADPGWLQFGSTAAEKSAKAKTISSPVQSPIPLFNWSQLVTLVGKKNMTQEATEFVADFTTVHKNWFALRVKGDAMTSPTPSKQSFDEGEIIITDPDIQAEHGKFVIALLPKAKEATFKQYVIDGGNTYLKPLNPQYPITPIDKGAFIYGVVIAALKLLPV